MEIKDKNIYLLGFMGSGKSTIGRKLAQLLNWDFIDLDASIERHFNLSIDEIFERFGEDIFRKTEKEELEKTFKQQKVVVACGGGTPCFFNNMEQINTLGDSFYIHLSPTSLYYRLRNSKRVRPLVKNKNEEELEEYIKVKLAEREVFYKKAHFIVKGENLKAEEILNMLQLR